MNNILNWLWEEYSLHILFISFLLLSIRWIAYQQRDKKYPAITFGIFIIIYSTVFAFMTQDAIRALSDHPIFASIVMASTCIPAIILCSLSKYLKGVISIAIAIFLIALPFASTKNLLNWITIGIMGFVLPVIFFFAIESFDELKKILFGKEYRKCNFSNNWLKK